MNATPVTNGPLLDEPGQPGHHPGRLDAPQGRNGGVFAAFMTCGAIESGPGCY